VAYVPEERRTGIRSWGRGSWQLLIAGLVAVAVVVVVVLVLTGGGGGY
jgi:hypothetical protein